MCTQPKCLEAQKNANLKEGRGPSPAPKQSTAPKPSYNTSGDDGKYLNASGGFTVSKKFKKGIIQ